MATAEQLKALIRSHAQGDEERFLAIALQVAATAARQGHGRLATELRELVDAARAKRKAVTRPAAPTPLVQPRGELAGILSVGYPKTRLTDLVLDPVIRERLRRILLEHRQQHKLLEHGLQPRRHILLVGPSGCGKTMTASALAGEMSLPLFTIVLEGLITKFMGETAAKLRLVFDAIRETRGVYLFDEFDAIGGRRSAGNDVGEIRRVLNSFLQLIEQDESDALVIAATNHPQLLDPALFRRFDDVIEYDVPTAELSEHLMRSRLAVFETSAVSWSDVADAARALSYAEITRACDDAAKETVLSDRRSVTTEALLRALQERRALRPE
jgi:SpoVK/Ycf46/Vps4 family AAA+-type ATPase